MVEPRGPIPWQPPIGINFGIVDKQRPVAPEREITGIVQTAATTCTV